MVRDDRFLLHPRLHPKVVIGVARELWPEVDPYDKQTDLFWSALTCPETHVPAGNKLGKDFIVGLLAPSVFIACQVLGITCRIITTSVAEHHLKVVWGEIGRFLTSASRTLIGRPKDDPPLVVNYMELRRAEEQSAKNPTNYLVGRVSEKGEGLAGHHAEFTMLIGDEASGLSDEVDRMAQGWAKSRVYIGNPNECQNFWRKAIRAGDLYTEGGRCLRRVIRIRATDSPNVKQRRDDALDGVLTWTEYQDRRATWDADRQSVGLDAEFYEGPGLMMYPSLWISRANRLWEEMNAGEKRRRPTALGIDPGEGVANTSFTFGDEHGIVKIESKPTPDTSETVGLTIAYIEQYGIDPGRVCIDQGGGGKEIADMVRARGYPIRTVPFGAGVTRDPKPWAAGFEESKEVKEDRYVYLNRRCQMFHEVRLAMDPTGGCIFTVPPSSLGHPYDRLEAQMRAIPLKHNEEGRIVLPPKNKRDRKDTRQTLIDMIGHSPDELDSVVLMHHAMTHEGDVAYVGVL